MLRSRGAFGASPAHLGRCHEDPDCRRPSTDPAGHAATRCASSILHDHAAGRRQRASPPRPHAGAPPRPARSCCSTLRCPARAAWTCSPRFRARLHPRLPVVVLSATHDRATVGAALAAGARGYVSKTANATGRNARPRCVTAALAGKRPSRVTCAILRVAWKRAAHVAYPRVFGLTPAPGRDVLRLLVQGKPNKLICRDLRLSEGTVKVHVSAILKALNVHSAHAGGGRASARRGVTRWSAHTLTPAAGVDAQRPAPARTSQRAYAMSPLARTCPSPSCARAHAPTKSRCCTTSWRTCTSLSMLLGAADPVGRVLWDAGGLARAARWRCGLVAGAGEPGVAHAARARVAPHPAAWPRRRAALGALLDAVGGIHHRRAPCGASAAVMLFPDVRCRTRRC